jgi:hypothetical protein
MRALFYPFFDLKNVMWPEVILPTGIAPEPNIFDQFLKDFFAEKVFSDRHCPVHSVELQEDNRFSGIFFQHGCDQGTALKPLRLLPEVLILLGKGKPFVYLPNKTLMVDAMNSAHQISNVPLTVNRIDLPRSLIGVLLLLLVQLNDTLAEVLCEEEVVFKEQKVCVDVEKAESDNPSI